MPASDHQQPDPNFATDASFRMPGSTVADCGIFVVDSAGLIASWNPGAERLTGFTAADVVGRPAAVLGAELGAGAPRAPHDAPPSPDCSASDREAVVRRKDGSTFRASVATSAFEMNAGRANAVAIREVSDERTSQEALRKTATLLRAVAEGTTDLVFVKDLAGRYLLLNEAARSAAGRPMDEILGRTDAELLDPQNAKRVMGRDRHVVETGRAETEEEEAVVGGVPRVYLTTKAPCRDDGGKVVGVIGIARDITDRKRVEEALADRERKLAEAQRIAHLGHWERDLQTGRVTWSEETYRVFGMAPGGPAPELPALVEKVHPDDRRLMEDAIARALRGGPSYDLQYRVLRPNGDIRFVHSHCEVKRDASGAPCALFGVVQDVTDRKRVEEALEESEERHRLALDVAALGTWRHDLLTGVAYLDARTQEVWSFDHAEVRWEDLVARVHPDDREGLTTKRTASCNPGSDGDYANEFRIVRPDGDVRWLAARARIFFEGEGPARRPTLAIGTTADVTDRRRADEAIRRSEELLRRAEAMANVAAWTFDIASGTFTYSDQAARICGRRPGPHRIDDWLSAVHPQDREIDDWDTVIEGVGRVAAA